MDTERSILAAALLYSIQLGLSFRDTMIHITSSTVNEMIQKMLNDGNWITKMILGDTANLKGETLAAFDREIHNKLLVFSIDPHIINAFRDSKKDSDCFTWNDLDNYNIFLRIPAEMIEQWSGVINLMYTQLIHHLERRPDMYTPKGIHNTQTLLLMDEFARFGKLEMIANALATLRSKNVNICLILQSLAQLDKLYGTFDRRIILDNCQYKAILSANDAETQEYFSNLIGTHFGVRHGQNNSYDELDDCVGYTEQTNETREPIIYPHEFSTLTDVLLLSQYGFCRVDKLQLHNDLSYHPLLPKPLIVTATSCEVIPSPDKASPQRQCDDDKQTCVDGQGTIIIGEGTSPVYCKVTSVRVIPKSKTKRSTNMLSVQNTIDQSMKHIVKVKHSKRIQLRQQKNLHAKKDQRRNYIIGELVSRYFPEVTNLEVGTTDENAVTFKPLESFLSVLAADRKLINQLKEKVTDQK